MIWFGKDSNSEESVSFVDEDEREVRDLHDKGDEEEEEEETPDENDQEELIPLTQQLNLRNIRKYERNLRLTTYAAVRLHSRLSTID